ncbi:hypothetical protein J6590_094309 [Homalodisca vitripennis]|nr:hypothetical protein J6590_094309 [Homalodisca vitripennis]
MFAQRSPTDPHPVASCVESGFILVANSLRLKLVLNSGCKRTIKSRAESNSGEPSRIPHCLLCGSARLGYQFASVWRITDRTRAPTTEKSVHSVFTTAGQTLRTTRSAKVNMADSKLFMSPDFLTFIEEYRNLPCLWKVRSAEYSNKFKRDTAWEHLLQITKETIPNADTNFVKRKVDNLRATFRKEMRKVRDSTRSGASADNTYTPTLWYFELMKFTAEQEQPRKTKSNLDEDEENIVEEEGSIVEAELNKDENNVVNEQALNIKSQCTAPKRIKISPKRNRGEEELHQRKAILEKASVY